MRRSYIYFLLTYFHDSSKKGHITKYSIKSTINSTEAANLPGPSSAPSALSSNWPAATPTGRFLSGPSARHVLVRPIGANIAPRHLTVNDRGRRARRL